MKFSMKFDVNILGLVCPSRVTIATTSNVIMVVQVSNLKIVNT